jgi:hypothetical protein
MIIGILGSGGCGGTFLDWSLHFLAGDRQSYAIRVDQHDRSRVVAEGYFDLTLDPITGTTAHRHRKTHPNNGSLQKVIDIFTALPPERLYSFYYVDSMSADQTQTTHNQIIEGHPDVNFICYTYSPDDIDKIFCLQVEKIPQYLENMLSDWLQINPDMPAWDQREQLSLYYPKCIQGQTINEMINAHPNCFALSFTDMLEHLDRKILEIFDRYKITMDQDRWIAWLGVYQLWKKGNSPEFFADLRQIINHILAGVGQDLTHYNMTFAKETIIASKLLYNHNKALKSHGIEKIPPNTLHWHELLEDNIYHNMKINTQEQS